MKRILSIFLIVYSLSLLVGCAAGRYPYPDTDLTREVWRGQMDTTSTKWVMKADRWFRAGLETPAEIMNQNAPYSDAMTRTAVRVPNFHALNISGNFQVQISGNPYGTGMWIEGPNAAARAISVKTRNNVLCIEQVENPPVNMQRVIVHIDVKRLDTLAVSGTATVSGVRLYSNSFVVDSSSTGNIFLAGQINVKSAVSRNCGSIYIFTVCTNRIAIESYSSGDVNITAQDYVGLGSIVHKGTGDITVLHARGPYVKIDAYGKGKVNVSGRVGISEIRAAGEVCVFVDASLSESPCIYVYDDARVGIAGIANVLHAYTTRTSRLMARNLVADNIFAESSGASLMNITATTRVFATARDYSSIYFYGDPGILQSFKNGSGTVIAMEGGPRRIYPTRKIVRRAPPSLDPMIEMSSADTSSRRYKQRGGIEVA